MDEAVVGSGSASEETVPVSRFNGLMGKYQQEQNSWKVRETQLVEELEALRTATPQETSDVSDVSALQAEIAELKSAIGQLAAPLVENSRANTLAKVFEEFPEAKLFEDILVGEDPDDIRETAKVIAERMRSSSESTSTANAETTGTETTTATETAAAPAAEVAPVTGGGSTFTGAAASQDRVSDAIKAKDFSGWLRAKRETDPSWRGETEVLSA